MRLLASCRQASGQCCCGASEGRYTVSCIMHVTPQRTLCTKRSPVSQAMVCSSFLSVSSNLVQSESSATANSCYRFPHATGNACTCLVHKRVPICCRNWCCKDCSCCCIASDYLQLFLWVCCWEAALLVRNVGRIKFLTGTIVLFMGN
jgi:hypothetical protein